MGTCPRRVIASRSAVGTLVGLVVRTSSCQRAVVAQIVAIGTVGLASVYALSADLVLWLLPVCVPMILAPVLIAWSSRPLTHSLFRVPDEADPSPVVTRYRKLMANHERRVGANDNPTPGQGAAADATV